MTDGVGEHWYTPRVWEWLTDWGSGGPTVLVDPLPVKLWSLSAIGPDRVRVRASSSGASNTDLRYRQSRFLARTGRPTTAMVPIPVTEFSPSALMAWAATVADAHPDGCVAVLAGPGSRHQMGAPRADDADAAGSLWNFIHTASPAALRLAVLAAVSEATDLPVMRAIQDEMLPDSSISDLAEVLVSGIFWRVPGADGGATLRIRMYAACRAQLQARASVQDQWDVYRAISAAIARRYPGAASRFQATVLDTSGNVRVEAEHLAFAEVARSALVQARQGSHGGAPAGTRGADDENARDALDRELGQLTGNGAFTVAGFAADAATIFEISRDEHGTPTFSWWEYRYDNGELIVDDEEPDQWSEAMADPARFYRHVAPRFIVRTPGRLASGLRALLPGPRDVPVYQCQAPLRDLLRAVVSESPLMLGYELAVLKRVPADHTGPERLVLTGHPLFSPGDTQDSRVTVRVNVEPTDDEGTVFAVVTREPRPDLPRHSRRLRLMQARAAVVPPGVYDLTAVLTRPGKVRFHGLPVPLGESGRSWDDLERLVPGQLTVQVPVHLVCLVEVCGGEDLLRLRLDRLEELITEARAGGLPLRVSVVAYGPHGVAWRVDDRPPEIRAWAAPGDEAIKALRGLAGRQVDEREYQRAAQLECALRLVRERLAPAEGRPVIVTAGGRPAHPPGLDTSRQLIPCPEWVDGMSELAWLQRLPGATFGVLRDPRCRGVLWERLGRDGVATVDDAVDMEGFAARLGLRVAAQTVPFPVIEQ